MILIWGVKINVRPFVFLGFQYEGWGVTKFVGPSVSLKCQHTGRNLTLYICLTLIQIWGGEMVCCLSACPSFLDLKIKDEMKRLLVCPSYLEPKMSEMKRSLSVRLFNVKKVCLAWNQICGMKWNVVFPSCVDSNIRGDMKRSLSVRLTLIQIRRVDMKRS